MLSRVALPREETCCGLQYFDGLFELSGLAAQLTQLPLLLARYSRRLTGIDLSLAHPLAQRLSAHPQPARDRPHRRPLRVIVITVLAEQPHRPVLRTRVVPDRHRAILPSKGSAHKTGDGSEGQASGHGPPATGTAH